MTRPEFGTLQRGRDIFDLLEVVHGRTSYSLTAYSPQTRAAKPQSRQIQYYSFSQGRHKSQARPGCTDVRYWHKADMPLAGRPLLNPYLSRRVPSSDYL
jgi:hypothetical protein